jgi:DNA invertase Pin-like site-specific DNA recombinase
MPLRAVVYARQSLDRSGEGAAVDRQVAGCQRLADVRGWQVVEVVTDNDMSATSRKPRPGYARVLAMIEAGAVDRVVVYAVDRLVRRLADLEAVIDLCEARGVAIVSAAGDLDLSTDQGQMLARILASVAQQEVARKGKRQRDANRQRAENGHMGWTRRPFGYQRVDGRVVVDEAEAAGLREAAAIVLAGGTLAAGCRSMTARGLTSSVGKPWNIRGLRYALLSPRYAGRVTHNGADVGEGAWPVILDTETQQRLREVLRDVGRRTAQSREPVHLLSGLARCGRCGGVMHASPMNGGVITLRCTSCYLARRADLVDIEVEAAVIARLTRPDAVARLTAEADVDALRAEADELRRRRDDLAGLLADGLMSAAAVRERAQALTDRVGDLERQVTAAVGSSPAAALASADDVAAAWDALDVRTRKAVVDQLVTVRVLPAGKGVRFQPEHVEVAYKGQS